MCAYVFEMYKVICNYLYSIAGNASSSGLPELLQLNEKLHCLLHIQLSPHCFDSLNKKWLHYTLNTNYTLQTHWMSKISQLSKLAISDAAAVTSTAAIPSKSYLPPATKSRGFACNFVIGWRGAFFHQ